MKPAPTTAPTTAVLFAYHNVGVRCLSALLAHGVRVPLCITHQDDPLENKWFDSVAELAALEGIETITPEDPNTPEIVERIHNCHPDYIFSFYYRKMLNKEILAIANKGAYNLHGSLLPKYRGRVPINWAVLHGEQQTGVSLHQMVLKPDAGALIAQEAVAILPNDTAHDVFQKAVCASERLLLAVMPQLLSGTMHSTALDLSKGSYFGRRQPEDGRIDWRQSAWQIHNLIRAVAPPYPGAYFDVGSQRVRVLRSHYRQEASCVLQASGQASGQASATTKQAPRLYWENDACYVDCLDGQRLLLRQLAIGDQIVDKTTFQQWLAATDIQLIPEEKQP